MTSKFRMFNLCVLKRIQWSAQAREVSWTSCSMLGGLSLAQSWYFYMFGPKWSVECSNVTAFMIHLVQSNQQIPPHPKIQKSARECTTWLSLFGETEIQTPFLPKTANIMNHGDLIPENGFEAANTFFCRNHKSHLTSLCCRVSWDTVSFVFRTRRKTITSKPNSSTVSWSHHS